MTEPRQRIWVEQCQAAREIEDEFGADKALKYLVEEKFLNFLEAAEEDADFRAELPAFVAEIKTIFERWQLEVQQPRVRDNTPDPEQRLRFASSILPPYLRRSKSIDELIPWPYLKGISTGDYQEALQGPRAVSTQELKIGRQGRISSLGPVDSSLAFCDDERSGAHIIGEKIFDQWVVMFPGEVAEELSVLENDSSVL